MAIGPNMDNGRTVLDRVDLAISHAAEAATIHHHSLEETAVYR